MPLDGKNQLMPRRAHTQAADRVISLSFLLFKKIGEADDGAARDYPWNAAPEEQDQAIAAHTATFPGRKFVARPEFAPPKSPPPKVAES